jgi:hypothetical protein
VAKQKTKQNKKPQILNKIGHLGFVPWRFTVQHKGIQHNDAQNNNKN